MRTSWFSSVQGRLGLIFLAFLLLLIISVSVTFSGLAAQNQDARIINLAGRQRMLSQRIAKFYMLGQWGIRDPAIEKGIEQAKTEFVSALNELENSPLNTRQTANALIDARIQWDHFLVALDEQETKATNTGSAIMAAFASEHLLEEMDKITSLYEESAAGQ